MLEDMRRRMARALWPKGPRGHARMYAGARPSRLTGGWTTGTTSADSELYTSLPILRERSRALVRDAAYAKRARVIVQNNVVGAGIGMQAGVRTSRGDLATSINDAIEAAWEEWVRAQNCHTGGALHFSDLERLAIGQVFEAGEILIRKHPIALGESTIPFALEVIEPERLADQFAVPSPPDTNVRMGIEQDFFGRPVAYWLRKGHPGDIRPLIPAEQLIRVPASEIFHLRLVDRWPQSRGEPWLHAVCRKLNDMDGYSEAEIVAARGAACYLAVWETPDLANPALGDEQPDGSEVVELTPGQILKSGPGEKFTPYMPNRPNSALDPFLRYMLREVAAGLSISYESLSRDYSQSNYSSSRLSLLDDRDVWRMLQQWFIRSFREQLHRDWLEAAVLSRAIPKISVEEYSLNREKFRAVTFKPRGWGWVDPVKEVGAAKEAVRNGFTTVSRVIAATADGADLEDILNERTAELEAMHAQELFFDTDPTVAAKGEWGTQGQPTAQEPGGGQNIAADGSGTGDGTTTTGDGTTSIGDGAAARVVKMRATK